LRVDGFDLAALGDSELNERLTRPLAAFWARDGQDIVLFVNPDLRTGAYPIGLLLPSGQVLQATLDHTETPKAAQPSFSFGPQVPDAEQNVVREAVALAAEFIAGQTGIRAAGVEVLATHAVEDIASQYARARKAPADFSRQVAQRAAPLPLYKRLFLNTGSTWSQTKREDKILQLVHEYFHVIQHDLVGGNFLDADLRGGGPKWLLEGAAVVFTDQVLMAAGGPLASHASFVRKSVYGTPATGPLQQYETNDRLRNPPDGSGIAGGYARSMKAVDSLLVNHDLSDLMSFWEYQGQGLSWRDAFVAAFGEPIEQFYARNP
jgi:hypothetical protein